jgi:general secretion pathway protein F
MARAEGDRTYYFRAGAPEGGVFSGRLEAASEADAISQLRHRGYLPLRVHTSPLRQSFLDREISLGAPKRLTEVECEALCRELAILLKAGLELADAVSVMTPSLQKGSRLHAFSLALRQGLRLGRRFSQAVEQTGFRCPSDFLPVIRAGEDSGSLATALTLLANTYAENGRFSRLFVGALIYPAFLLVTAFFVLGIIAFFVAPNLTGLFVSMDRPVPLAIALLDGTASFMAANALPLMLGGAMLATGMAVLAANRGFRRRIHAIVFRLPLIGSALVWSASRRFAATLQLYIASNVAIASALPNAFIAAGFPDGQRRAAELVDEVRKGGRLSTALEKARIMPAKLIHLVRVGESSGQLLEVLTAVVEESRIRFEKRMTLLSSLLAPSLILVVGVLVGTIIFAVFSALLDVNELTF